MVLSMRGEWPIHLSFQNDVLRPFPTNFALSPCKIGIVFRIPFHTNDIFVFGLHVSQSKETTKYFALRTWVHRTSSFCISRHPSLAIKASFILSSLRRPRPPSDLLLVIVSQLTRWHFLEFAEFPHKKFLMSCSIDLVTPRGKSVVCIVKYGIADRTDCARTSLPASESVFYVQPASLLWILSIMPANESFFSLPWIEGTPKYLPKFSSLGIPVTSMILCCISIGVLLEKWMADFWIFTFWPECSLKILKQLDISSVCSNVASPNNTISSAKKQMG